MTKADKERYRAMATENLRTGIVKPDPPVNPKGGGTRRVKRMQPRPKARQGPNVSKVVYGVPPRILSRMRKRKEARG